MPKGVAKPKQKLSRLFVFPPFIQLWTGFKWQPQQRRQWNLPGQAGAICLPQSAEERLFKLVADVLIFFWQHEVPCGGFHAGGGGVSLIRCMMLWTCAQASIISISVTHSQSSQHRDLGRFVFLCSPWLSVDARQFEPMKSALWSRLDWTARRWPWPSLYVSKGRIRQLWRQWWCHHDTVCWFHFWGQDTMVIIIVIKLAYCSILHPHNYLSIPLRLRWWYCPNVDSVICKLFEAQWWHFVNPGMPKVPHFCSQCRVKACFFTTFDLWTWLMGDVAGLVSSVFAPS